MVLPYNSRTLHEVLKEGTSLYRRINVSVQQSKTNRAHNTKRNFVYSIKIFIRDERKKSTKKKTM